MPSFNLGDEGLEQVELFIDVIFENLVLLLPILTKYLNLFVDFVGDGLGKLEDLLLHVLILRDITLLRLISLILHDLDLLDHCVLNDGDALVKDSVHLLD